jgi:hypothetical protein
LKRKLGHVLVWEVEKTLARAHDSRYFALQSLAVSSVTDLHKALAEIHSIRGQLARNAEFRGYGPATLALTGALALLAALIQAHWLKDPARHVGLYLAIWIPTAAVSLIIISVEAITRARRVHFDLADEMVHAALEQFVPAIVAGLLLTVVLYQSAQQSLWMLPGLWQVLFSMGVFASCRFLPRQMFAVGVWYLAAGLACLAFAGGERSFSPWIMAAPFGIGQLLVAAVLQFGYREADEEP